MKTFTKGQLEERDLELEQARNTHKHVMKQLFINGYLTHEINLIMNKQLDEIVEEIFQKCNYEARNK